MGRKAGYRPDGTRVVRPDAAALAKPKVKFITHGGKGALLRDPLDARTKVARLYRARLDELRAHVGEEFTPALARVVEQAARLSLLVDTAWGEVNRVGMIANDGAATGALDAFLRASRDEREVLKLLGFTRRQSEVVDVAAEIARQNDEEARDGRP